MHGLFPRWTRALGIEARLEGVDLPLDSARERYRALVLSVLGRDDVLGAVITSHKLTLFSACVDLFAETDEDAVLCREANCLWKSRAGLAAGARDPVAATAVLDEMLADRPQPAEVLCLGAGGAARALAVALLVRRPTRASTPPPSRLVFTDVREDRLASLESTLTRLEPHAARVEVALTRSPDEADAVLRSLAPGSLVVNATGVGKDSPGSPLGPAASFPAGSVVWDLNYRGDLQFLAQARAQQRERALHLHDGWRYFLHGWFESLAPVLGFDPDPALFRRMSTAAD